jgi:hypothetical protein
MGDHFYSSNLKHYLKLAPHTKLLLTSMSIDDHLERGWEHEQYGGEFYTNVGVDYWTPLAFSIWGGEAKMHMYYQFLRMLYSAEKGEGWFVISSVPKSRLKIDDLLARWVAACPQVMFNTQVANNDQDIQGYMADVKWWDTFAPKDVAFWCVGATSPTFMHNLRKMAPGREFYWISGKPIYNANSGKLLRKDGGEATAPKDMPKKELLYLNMQTFEEMVARYG